jgi:hypothetical protein
VSQTLQCCICKCLTLPQQSNLLMLSCAQHREGFKCGIVALLRDNFSVTYVMNGQVVLKLICDNHDTCVCSPVSLPCIAFAALLCMHRHGTLN